MDGVTSRTAVVLWIRRFQSPPLPLYYLCLYQNPDSQFLKYCAHNLILTPPLATCNSAAPNVFHMILKKDQSSYNNKQ